MRTTDVEGGDFDGILIDTVYHVVNDHLMTPRRIADHLGNVVWSWDSDAFGTSQAISSFSARADFPVRFPGQYFDSESRLHYNWNRYYSAEIGRYISSDPIGLIGGPNSFLYSKANPTNFIDSLGLASATVIPRQLLPPITRPVPTLSRPFDRTKPFPTTLDEPTSSPADPNGSSRDPCKGLRDQVKKHQEKLRTYRASPYRNDNRGFLENLPISRHSSVIEGRIRSLERQIKNFEKQLFECEQKHKIMSIMCPIG